jgi:response regulator NasT
LLLSFRVKIKKLESKADKLQQKLEDDRLVSRAKILLVERLKMSEQDAHHYIEKMAMDRCVKKTTIANDIIRMYEGN